MLELYFAVNTCAMAPHIVLEEIGQPYLPRPLNFRAAQQRTAEYLAVNPKGRVPALVTERGVLTETPAILAYLAQRYPGADLAPLDDAFAFARAQAFNSYLCSTVHVAHAHRLRGARWSDDPAAHESMKARAPRNMVDCFELIEEQLLAGPWVLGERYSICDAYLFTVTRWLAAHEVDHRRFPKVAAHTEAMMARPAVRRVVAAHDAAAAG